ncbi:hypothetical protein PGTUg99_027011 [Puccinia graminis f. sp. tritici]|uniref:Uncharacterized protein n=1 Tax=Puccinia graminis f. sp. tritici TaxID=56615 RepID=A0A5B0SGN2_PUCGR|nr:hypothetical protein PGTUg99_027011 [Puccinia graminis f. sp. tritici]
MPQSHSQNQLLIYVLHSPLETPTRSISCRQFCRELSNLLLSRPSNGHLSLTQSNPEPTLLNPHSPLPISLFPIRHCRFPTELSPIVPLNCIRGFRLCWMGDNRGQFCLSTVIVRSLGRKRTPRAHCGFGGSVFLTQPSLPLQNSPCSSSSLMNLTTQSLLHQPSAGPDLSLTTSPKAFLILSTSMRTLSRS